MLADVTAAAALVLEELDEQLGVTAERARDETEGRVDRFTKRFGTMSVEKRKETAAANKAASAAKKKTTKAKA